MRSIYPWNYLRQFSRAARALQVGAWLMPESEGERQRVSSIARRWSALASILALGANSAVGQCPTDAGATLHFTTGRFAKAVSSPSLRPTSAVTLEAWVRADNLDAGQIGIAGSWDDQAGANRTWVLWILNQHPQFVISHNHVDAPRASSPTALSTGVWHHLAGTFDGSSIKLYVDGTLASEVASAGSLATNTRPFYVGRTDTGGGGLIDYFPGTIDNIRVWNVARTAEEIQTLMNYSPCGALPGLVLAWSCDDNGGQSITDGSGFGNHGILGATTASEPSDPTWESSNAPVGHIVIENQPDSVATCPDSTIRLSVGAFGVPNGGNLAYRWYRDDEPVLNDSRTSGSDSPLLEIRNVVPSDGGDFHCAVSNSCAALDSCIARVEICQQESDLNCDTVVDIQDLASLLSAYGTCSGDPEFLAVADFDGNGCIDLSDLAAILANFGMTCR